LYSKQADADSPPGLRLWWEYLECVDWDARFYDTLVRKLDEAPRAYGGEPTLCYRGMGNK